MAAAVNKRLFSPFLPSPEAEEETKVHKKVLDMGHILKPIFV